MIEEIIKKGGDLLYCDTDSMICKLPPESSVLETDTKELGKLKLENVFTDFIYNGKLKKYFLWTDADLKTENEAKNFVLKHSKPWHAKYFANCKFIDLIQRKGAISGLPKKLIKILSYEQAELLFSQHNNVFFTNVRQVAHREQRFKMIDLWLTGAEFNAYQETKNNDGSIDIKGIDRVTHVAALFETFDESKLIIREVEAN